MVITATTTPDHPCPATAPDVAARLDLGPAAAFDVAAGCSRFVYAPATAAAALVAGHAEHVLVIGAEISSTVLNPADRHSGDLRRGAGAVVLRAKAFDEPGAILAVGPGADGTGKDLVTIPGGRCPAALHRSRAAPDARYVHMRGKETLTQAVRRMEQPSAAVPGKAGWSVDQVDHVVGHLANLRIPHAPARQLGDAFG